MVNSSSSTSHSEVGCYYSYYSTCLTSCFFFARWIASSKRTSCNSTAKNCAWQVVTCGHAELLSFPQKLSSLFTSGSMLLLFLPPGRPFPSWCFRSGIRFPRKLPWGGATCSSLDTWSASCITQLWHLSCYIEWWPRTPTLYSMFLSPYYTENVHVCMPSHAEFCVSPHYTEWCLCVCVPSQ